MSLVSTNIRFLRKQLGLTQEKLATKIGIKRSLLGAYEEARAEPRLINLQNMADIFGVTVDSLMNEDLTSSYNQSKSINLTRPDITISNEKYSAPDLFNTMNYGIKSYENESNKFFKPSMINPEKEEIKSSQFHQSGKINQDYVEGKKLRMLSITVDHKNKENIEFVSQSNIKDYLLRFGDPEYLESLPRFQLPMLPEGELYRAFESGNEALSAMTPGSVVIGRYVRNWYSLKDQQIYILVTRSKGILCKKVTNNIQAKGLLLLTADNADFMPIELPVEDVLEIWEAKAFISMHLPDNDVSLQKLASIVMDLQQEIKRMKKDR